MRSLIGCSYSGMRFIAACCEVLGAVAAITVFCATLRLQANGGLRFFSAPFADIAHVSGEPLVHCRVCRRRS